MTFFSKTLKTLKTIINDNIRPQLYAYFFLVYLILCGWAAVALGSESCDGSNWSTTPINNNEFVNPVNSFKNHLNHNSLFFFCVVIKKKALVYLKLNFSQQRFIELLMLFSFLPLIFYFLKKAFKTLTLNTFTFFSKSIVYFLKLYFRYRASTSRDFKDIAKWSVNFKLPSLFIKIGVTLFVTLNFLNFIYSYFKILKSTVNRIAQHSFVFYLNYPVFRLLSADPTEWLFIFLKNNFIHLFTVFGSFFFKKLSVLYLKFLFYIGGFLSYFLTFLNYTISTFENILTFFFLVISVIIDKIPTLVSILTIYFDLIFLSKVRVLFVILKSIIR